MVSKKFILSKQRLSVLECVTKVFRENKYFIARIGRNKLVLVRNIWHMAFQTPAKFIHGGCLMDGSIRMGIYNVCQCRYSWIAHYPGCTDNRFVHPDTNTLHRKTTGTWFSMFTFCATSFSLSVGDFLPSSSSGSWISLLGWTLWAPVDSAISFSVCLWLSSGGPFSVILSKPAQKLYYTEEFYNL